MDTKRTGIAFEANVQGEDLETFFEYVNFVQEQN